MSVPAPERRSSLSRFQKVSVVTGVAAVGATALALAVVPGRGESTENSAAELPVNSRAWPASAIAADGQRASIEVQTDRAADRARVQLQDAARRKAQARAEARRRAAQKAAKAREKARAATSRSERRAVLNTTSAPSGSPQAIARQLVGDSAQYSCFAQIVDHESGWDVHAQNPSSGAYGLLQALPGSKMSSAGPDWRNNAATQIKWGLHYMKSRYESPCGAWNFWQSNRWY